VRAATDRSRRATLAHAVLRTLFALLLGAGAAGKLAEMPGFLAIVESYRVLPAPLVPAAGWLLALAEAALAGVLATGWWPQLAAAGVVALHGAYFAWVLAALARGLELANCGCFGVYFARPLGWNTALEDAVLLALAVALYRLAPRR